MKFLLPFLLLPLLFSCEKEDITVEPTTEYVSSNEYYESLDDVRVDFDSDYGTERLTIINPSTNDTVTVTNDQFNVLNFVGDVQIELYKMGYQLSTDGTTQVFDRYSDNLHIIISGHVILMYSGGDIKIEK